MATTEQKFLDYTGLEYYHHKNITLMDEKDATVLAEAKGYTDTTNESIAEITEALAVERARIDAFTALPEGSTSGDAALEDIKIKADGTTADTAGNAVREQINTLDSKIDEEVTALDTKIDEVHGQLSSEIEEIESRFIPIYDNIGGMAVTGNYVSSDTTDIRGVCVGCKAMEFNRIVLKQTITNNTTLTVAIYDKTLENKLLEKKVDVMGRAEEQEIIVDFDEKIVMNDSWYLDVQLPFNTDNTFTSYSNSAELNYSVVDSYSYPSYMYIKVSKERFSNQFKIIPCDFYVYLGIGIEDLIVEEKESETETENNSTVPFSMFDTFGVIGDSFSVGYVKYNEYGVTKTNYAWGKQISRKYGNKCEIYGKGGLSTRTWLSDSEGLTAMNNGTANDMYFLALGINDANGIGIDYLGTIADIHDGNPNDNPDTFYGNYGKIVEAVKAKSPHAKLCFVTIPGILSIHKTFANAIKEIAEHYGCVVADIQNDEQFQSKVRYYDGHLTYPLYGFMGVRIVELLEKQLLGEYFRDFMDFN